MSRAAFEDHGLPLVQLKEQRRDMIVALIGRKSPITHQQISDIAAIQNVIAAMEAVIIDLDEDLRFAYGEQSDSLWLVA